MKTINIMTNMNYVYFFDTLYFVNLPYTVSFNTSGSSMLKLWKHFLLRGIICCQCITVYIALHAAVYSTLRTLCTWVVVCVYTHLKWRRQCGQDRKPVWWAGPKWLLREKDGQEWQYKMAFEGGKMFRNDNKKWLLRGKDGQEWQQKMAFEEERCSGMTI